MSNLVKLGYLIGFCLGCIFLHEVRSLCLCISRHVKARKRGILYTNLLTELGKGEGYVRAVNKTNTARLMSSKFVELLSYLGKILVILITLVLLILLLILNAKGYSEFFEMKW